MLYLTSQLSQGKLLVSVLDEFFIVKWFTFSSQYNIIKSMVFGLGIPRLNPSLISYMTMDNLTCVPTS